MFSTFIECSQMSGVFYHSVIHDRLRLFYLLYDLDFIVKMRLLHCFGFFFFFLCYINLILKTFCFFGEISIINFFRKKCFPPSLTKMSTRGNVARNNITRFFYVLHCDKTWVFDQSERAPGPIYIINKQINKYIYIKFSECRSDLRRYSFV